ncbi:MAG: porin [Proteobacteria bacterium]|nr:porin [Pseudomonadota bacterium]
MKKISSILAAFTAFGTVSAAIADSVPTITFGGYQDAYWGYVSEANIFRHTNPTNISSERRRNNAIASETKLILRADGIRDSCGCGLKYGGLIALNADTSDDHYDDFFDAQQTMVYFEGNFGRVEAGSYTGASHALHVSPTQISRGHSGIDGGGIDSDWWKWVNPMDGVNESNIAFEFLLLPQLYTNNIALLGIKSVNASKITYYTPRYYGFQAGISYTPDIESFGTVSYAMHNVFKYNATDGMTGASGGKYRDIFEGGIQYAGEYRPFSFKVGLVGEIGNPKFDTALDKFRRMRAWEAGMAVGWRRWTIASAYGNLGKTGTSAVFTPTGNNSKYWTVGVAYQRGPIGISAAYAVAHTVFDIFEYTFEWKSRAHTVSLGADWRMADGIKLYADAVHFSLKEVEVHEPGNRGTVLRVGFLLNF